MTELMRRRRAIMGMAKAGGVLPSEYQQVEWIGQGTVENYNAPYLDTMENAKLSTRIEAGFQRCDTSLTSYPPLFGCKNPMFLAAFARHGTAIYVNVGNSGEKTIQNQPLRDTFHDLVLDKNGFSVDGVTVSTFNATQLVEDASTHILVFARSDGSGGSVSIGVMEKCSYFRIYDGQNLVCNLIPCYRKADSVIGMYDTVKNAFRTKVAGNDFEKGADV